MTITPITPIIAASPLTTSVLWWLAETTVITAILIPIVAILARFFRHRPAVQHTLWLVVLIKFITPTFFTSPWSIEISARTGPAAAPLVINDAPTRMTPAPARPAEPARITPGTTRTIFIALAALWAAGALAAAARLTLRIHRQTLLVRRGSAPPAPLTDSVHRVARRLHMRPIPARVIRAIHSPFVSCAGRATLAWPESLLAPGPRLRSVIAHELAHIRRGDHRVIWLELAATALWWWNPLFWIARRQLRASAEMACDAVALDTYPSDRRDYAQALLNLSATAGSPTLALGISAGPAFFERRLSMIASSRTRARATPVGWGIAGLLALAALPGWSSAEPDTKPTQPYAANVVFVIADAVEMTLSLEELRAREATLLDQSEHLDLQLRPLLDLPSIDFVVDEIELLEAQLLDVDNQIETVRAQIERLEHPELFTGPATIELRYSIAEPTLNALTVDGVKTTVTPGRFIVVPDRQPLRLSASRAYTTLKLSPTTVEYPIEVLGTPMPEPKQTQPSMLKGWSILRHPQLILKDIPLIAPPERVERLLLVTPTVVEGELLVEFALQSDEFHPGPTAEPLAPTQPDTPASPR